MVVSWWLVWVNGVGGVFQDHVTQVSNWVKMNRSCESKDHTMARLGNWVTMALFAVGMGERGERGETMGEYWGKELWPQDNFPQLMIYLINRKIICQSSLSSKAQVLLSVFFLFSAPICCLSWSLPVSDCSFDTDLALRWELDCVWCNFEGFRSSRSSTPTDSLVSPSFVRSGRS